MSTHAISHEVVDRKLYISEDACDVDIYTPD